MQEHICRSLIPQTWRKKFLLVGNKQLLGGEKTVTWLKNHGTFSYFTRLAQEKLNKNTLFEKYELFSEK